MLKSQHDGDELVHIPGKVELPEEQSLNLKAKVQESELFAENFGQHEKTSKRV